MANANSRFVAVTCEKCGCSGSIRIDQYNRRKGLWKCRSCNKKGQVPKNKGKGIKHNPELFRTRNSYFKAIYRCKTGHNGYYKDVEFRFTSLQELINHIGLRPEGTTLDRINPLGHYELGNVRWATVKEQVRNKRNNIFVKYNGEEMCLSDAARISGMDRNALKRRFETGCPPEFLFADGKWFSKTQKFFPAQS